VLMIGIVIPFIGLFRGCSVESEEIWKKGSQFWLMFIGLEVKSLIGGYIELNFRLLYMYVDF
jgi:hypothetical protein